MSDSKMINIPSRVVFVKEPPEDLSTEEMERKFSKFRGFVTLRRFPNRAFVEFRSIEEASHFLHVMREEPICKGGPICRIYYDKDNGFDPTRAPSRKRKAGDMDREPYGWDRGGYYPEHSPADERRYEEYYRPSKHRRSEHDSMPRERSPRDRSRDRRREDDKREERNDRQKERHEDNDRPHEDASPTRDRDERRPDRPRSEERRPDRPRSPDREERQRSPDRARDNGEHVAREYRRDRPREHVPREHVPREHFPREDRPRPDRERSPDRARDPDRTRDREYSARDRPPSAPLYDEFRTRYVDPVHWERMVLPFFQDMGVTSFNVERVPNYQMSSTLYVNNLPPDATERVRMIHKEGKNSFCFVDFRDPDSAYVARSLLQGYRLDSRGGIHIEYDKGRK